jgi:aminoglycoside phosphotransferase family enzyme
MAPEPQGPQPVFADKLRFLSDGAHLGEPDAPVECVETHFACVFLTPRHAWKLRKPVRCGGVDTRELQARRASCEEELRINQALAPGVYLDVLALTQGPGGRLELQPAPAAGVADGRRIVDWLLKMRRLPAERMLDRVILERAVDRADLEAIGRHLDVFYAQQPPLGMRGAVYCRRLAAGIRHNRGQILAADCPGVDRPVVERAAQLQEQWLESHHDLLERRADEGWIRDCHGDLKPEHVCLGPPVCIIDRLDFDAALRALDPAEDLALLWLECERLGDPGTGEWLVRRHAGSSDAGLPMPLLHFYLGNRALTRARIAVWRLAEAGVDRALWLDRLRSYSARALSATEQALR